MMSFDVYRRWGKGWRRLGSYRAVSSLQAAKQAHEAKYPAGLKKLRAYAARPEDTTVPLFKYKFWSA